MHQCDSILLRLSMQLDHQLSSAERRQLQADLAECPECLALFEAVTRTDGLLRAAPAAAPRRDFAAGVITQIHRQRLYDRRLLGLTLLVGGAMSLGPTLVVGVSLLLVLLAAVQPGVLQSMIAIFVQMLSGFHAFLLTLATLERIAGPWLLPTLSALVGMVLLFMTLLWATRRWSVLAVDR